MKHIKLIVTITTVVIIYLIYALVPSKKIIYLALGDSFALGENPYGELSYGYSDYLASYLNENYKLKLYTKKFASIDARIKDVSQDILLNRKVYVNNKSVGLKSALREANVITLSIGANDIMNQINTVSKVMVEKKSEEMLKIVTEDLKELLQEIKKYNKKITLVGYYNLYPRDEVYSELFKKLDTEYQKISQKENITYISTYNSFPYEKYLPNPFNIHPSTEGYEYIYQQIIEEIDY